MPRDRTPAQVLRTPWTGHPGLRGSPVVKVCVPPCVPGRQGHAHECLCAAPHAGLEGSAAGPDTCVSSGCVPHLSEAAPARPCCAMLSAAGPCRATLPGLQAGATSFLQEANPVLGKADLQSSGTSSPSHRSPSASPGLPLQDRGLRNCWGPARRRPSASPCPPTPAP